METTLEAAKRFAQAAIDCYAAIKDNHSADAELKTLLGQANMNAARTMAAIAQVEATEAQTKVLADIGDTLATMHGFNEEAAARAATEKLWRTR